MRKILILCELSDSDLLLIDGVRKYVSAVSESHVYLVHVAAPDPDFIGYEAGPLHERNWRAEELHMEHSRLQLQASRLRREGIDTTALLLQGPTVEKTLEAIDRLGVDLIIVGSHQHGNIYRVLAGSISEEIVHKAQCPIILFPIKS